MVRSRKPRLGRAELTPQAYLTRTTRVHRLLTRSMNCDVCKQNQATVFLTQIVDGKMQKVNLCETCSKEKGVTDPTGFALADLLLGLGAAQEMERGGNVTKCPV